MSDLVVGEDGLARCAWGASTPDYAVYHDEEWGKPVRGDDALYEKLCLEAFQSGLSWLTILRKRPNFRAAFDDFRIERVATSGHEAPVTERRTQPLAPGQHQIGQGLERFGQRAVERRPTATFLIEEQLHDPLTNGIADDIECVHGKESINGNLYTSMLNSCGRPLPRAVDESQWPKEHRFDLRETCGRGSGGSAQDGQRAAAAPVDTSTPAASSAKARASRSAR